MLRFVGIFDWHSDLPTWSFLVLLRTRDVIDAV
jgi:hypothetical protein